MKYSEKLKFFLSYSTPIALGVTLSILTVLRYNSNKDQIKSHFAVEKQAELRLVTRNVEDIFKEFYQGLRTIALLPGVQNIDRYAKHFHTDSKKAVQVIYNNTYLNVGLSEIYILPKTLDPEKIDPVTGDLEEPIITFDKFIVGNSKEVAHEDTEEEDELEEVEIFEYQLMATQLKYLAHHFPTLSTINGLDYPAILGAPVITCDNSEFSKKDLLEGNDVNRMGLVYTVPKYSTDGNFSGAVSGVVRINTINNSLPKGTFLLASLGNNYFGMKDPIKELISYKSHLKDKTLLPNLAFYALEAAHIKDVEPWEIASIATHKQFETLPELRQSKLLRNLALLGCFVVTVLLIVIIYSVRTTSQLNAQRSKQELLGEKGIKSSIIDCAIDSIISINENHTIMDFNPRAEQVFGYSKNEILGKNVHTLTKSVKFDTAFQQGIIALSKNADGSSKIEQLELEMIRKDKSTVPVELNLSFTNLLGQIVAYAYIKDLTKLKEDEKIIEQQRANMVEASRLSSLGVMAGGIAHEINNPLTIIQGATRKIKKALLNASDHEIILNQVGSIESMVFRISKIIRGLKDISRDGSGDPFVETSVKDVIDESIALCKSKFERHQTQLIVNEISPSIKIKCRSVQIGQILINLMHNAIDAVHELKDRWVKIEVTEINGFVEIQVIDAGNGIPKETADKLATPFFTTKPVGKGTGLGLSLSLSIIKSHQGNLFYDPSKTHTTFVIRIPSYSNWIEKAA